MPARTTSIAILILALLIPARPVSAQSRFRTIRSTLRAHKSLRNTALPIAKSQILPDSVAAAKKYGDSWTCRSSTQLLLRQMGQSSRGGSLKMDSVGKNAFNWGKEGKVSYHYFGVDNLQRPRLLVDPTASSNFARDARPNGMLHGLLLQAGQKLGYPKQAERVARRVARGGIKGLLVLVRPGEIAVYREALEQAARLRADMTRNAAKQLQ